jgi:ribosomal protein S18 acetylase RimI-like enzyme
MSSPAFIIRQMRKDDLQQVAEAYVAAYEKIDVGEKWTVKAARELFLYWLTKQPDLSYVAEIHGKVVGAFVTGVKPWWDGNRLFDGEIFVHPDYQRRGIATELSKIVYKKALDVYQVVIFEATTFKKEEFPLKWYKSIGFSVSDDLTLVSGNVRTVLSHLEKK